MKGESDDHDVCDESDANAKKNDDTSHIDGTFQSMIGILCMMNKRKKFHRTRNMFYHKIFYPY